MMSSKSDISDLSTATSALNISKAEIMNTSIILKNPEPIEYCLTKFNFEASKNDELSFKANQYIRITKKVDGGWWEGKLDERIGWFPSDFVTMEIEPEKLQELSQNDKALTTEEISILKYKNIVFNRSQLQLSDLGHVEIEISEFEFVRNEITKDLIHSEEAYIEDIAQFTNNIIKPLENETWISSTDRNDMFGRIPWLSNLHICLMSELKSALNQPEEKSLGNCFSCVMQNFEIVYSDYFTSCPRAIYVASQYSSNDKMTTFLVNAGCQSLPPILHILSFLHKPIQRISKYSPILSELLHFTKPEDPGFDELVDMVTKFKQLEIYLKSLKETAEKQERLKNLYNSIEDWVGPGIENYGELLLESKVQLLDPSSSSTTPKTHFIYLLEKLFVVLKPISKSDNTKYSLVASVPVWKGTLNIVSDINELNNFQIIFLPSEQSNKLKTLTITVPKPDIKKQWIDMVKKQLDKNVRLTLPSLPKEVQEDLSANDTNQSKKKWKKLVPKFARTKGKNETTLPPYTSSNLLLKTSEGGTLISSTLSNLEHKIITEEKRKQGELLKMKYQEMDVNEELTESPSINDNSSSGVTAQNYPLSMTYDSFSRASTTSTSSTSTRSSSSSKMTTICTKYNVVERNTYDYDNTSSYSEGTAYTAGLNNTSMNMSMQMTKLNPSIGNEEKETVDQAAEDEFDRMMGNSSDEEEQPKEKDSAEDEFDRMMGNSSDEEENPTVKDEYDRMMANDSDEDQTARDEFDRMMGNSSDEDQEAKDEFDRMMGNSSDEDQDAKDEFDRMMGNSSDEDQEAKDEFDRMMGNSSSESNERTSSVPTISDSFQDAPELSKPEQIQVDDSLLLSFEKKEPSHLDHLNNDMSVSEQSQTYIDQHYNTNTLIDNSHVKDAPVVNPSLPEVTVERMEGEIKLANSTEKATASPLLEKSFSGLTKKESFETFISEEIKSFDTSSIRQMKSTTWYSGDSKSETEELKKNSIHLTHDHDQECLICQHDKGEDLSGMPKDHDVNILLELEELEKKNGIRKNEFSEISSITSLKSVQIHTKPMFSNHEPSSPNPFLKPELPSSFTPPIPPANEGIEREEEEEEEEEEEKQLNRNSKLDLPVPHSSPHNMYKNKNIVKEDLSTLLVTSSPSSSPSTMTALENQEPMTEEAHCPLATEQEIPSSEIHHELLTDPRISPQKKTEINNDVLNKIIEEKITQEITDKYGDISHKDLTIKIHINEEESSNDINIEIKINRNTEDKVPEVTIESESHVLTNPPEEEKERPSEEEGMVQEEEPKTKEDKSVEETTGKEEPQEQDLKEKYSTPILIEPETTTFPSNPTQVSCSESELKPKQPELLEPPEPSEQDLTKDSHYLHQLVSSPSTIATETTDATLSMMINEEDRLPISSSSTRIRSMDSYESKSTLQGSSLGMPNIMSPDLRDRSTLTLPTLSVPTPSDLTLSPTPPLSAVTEMKKHKSPLLSALSPLSSPTLPQLSLPGREEETIVGYGLLEKQFKFLLSRNQLQHHHPNHLRVQEERQEAVRYSDSFIHYPNVDFQNKQSVMAAEKEQASKLEGLNRSNSSSLLTQRLPKSFKSSQLTISTTAPQRSFSDSYTPTTPHPSSSSEEEASPVV